MPFGNALQGWHLIIILVVILLLFGAPKLPGLAKSLGQSMRIFKGEVKSMKDENNSDKKSEDASDSTDRVDRDRADRDRSDRDPADRGVGEYGVRNSSSDPQNKP